MNVSRILVVSDSPSLIRSIESLCNSSTSRFQVSIARSPTNAELLDPDLSLVVTHETQSTPAQQCERLLDRIYVLRPATPVVMISEDCSPQQMINWLRHGAAECLSAPFDPQRMLFLIDSLTINSRLTREQQSQSGDWIQRKGTKPFCCASPAMATLVRQVRKLAPQNSNVMLVGETGTGKTRIARMIHEESPRRSKPFVSINCAAMPLTLLESELFGHRRGAFTGADSDHVGKFSHVKEGTLLLDEVDTLSLEAQAKLLRIVDDRMFEPLGSNKSERFDGRLVVATNRNLSECVGAGTFRADLFYRLNVVELTVPPLRERKAEIIALAEACIEELSEKNRVATRQLSPEVRQLLEEYRWPGNIRELRNTMERAMTFAQGKVIGLTDLPHYLLVPNPSGRIWAVGDREHFSSEDATEDASGGSLAKTREQAEKSRLMEVLRKNNDNRSQAAKELGISRAALYKRLHKYGLVRLSPS